MRAFGATPANNGRSRLADAGLVIGLTFASAGLCQGTAVAGGYDVGQRDWDFLFQQDDVAFESAVHYVNPQRRLTDINGTLGPTQDTDETTSFTVPRFSAAARLTEGVRCLASYREPWAGYADYGTAWAYSGSAVEQSFSSEDYGLTCALSTPLAIGQLSVLGGVSYQQIEYELIQFYPAGSFPYFPAQSSFGNTKVSDDGYGWRTGVAFEIPEYALRASLIYNSQIDYDMTGTVTNPALPFGGFDGPVYGSIAMPQSVELKVQSGVAPGWLAFGSVTWTDWSVAQNMPLCPVGVTPCTQSVAPSALTLYWKDTWTVRLGAAHQVSEMFFLAGSVIWDQGATQGFTSQTDTWAATLAAVVKPNQHVELRFDGLVGILTGGSLNTQVPIGDVPVNPFGYSANFGDDLVYSLGATAIVRF